MRVKYPDGMTRGEMRYFLKDTPYYEEILQTVMKPEIIKPVFEKFIKNELIEIINKIKVGLLEADYKINYDYFMKRILFSDNSLPAAPSQYYFSYKYHLLRTALASKLENKIISLNELNKLKGNNNEIRRYSRSIIKDCVSEIFISELFLLSLLHDNFEAVNKDFIELTKKIYESEIQINSLSEELDKHRNKKGKKWREELFKLAKEEYENNGILDRTKALKNAFEKLNDNENHRKEFELKFKSILQTFYDMLNKIYD